MILNYEEFYRKELVPYGEEISVFTDKDDLSHLYSKTIVSLYMGKLYKVFMLNGRVRMIFEGDKDGFRN